MLLQVTSVVYEWCVGLLMSGGLCVGFVMDLMLFFSSFAKI